MTRGRRRFQVWILVVAVVILAQACSGDEPDDVRVTFSFPPTLTVNGWDGSPVETFCLVANETYVRVAPSNTPFADGIEEMLTPAAQIVEANCDATITTDIEGQALMGIYMNVGGLYTGWDISGTITLTADGRPPLVVQVEAHQEPPTTTRHDQASAGHPRDVIRRAGGGDAIWRHDFRELFTCATEGCLR